MQPLTLFLSTHFVGIVGQINNTTHKNNTQTSEFLRLEVSRRKTRTINGHFATVHQRGRWKNRSTEKTWESRSYKSPWRGTRANPCPLWSIATFETCYSAANYKWNFCALPSPPALQLLSDLNFGFECRSPEWTLNIHALTLTCQSNLTHVLNSSLTRQLCTRSLQIFIYHLVDELI